MGISIGSPLSYSAVNGFTTPTATLVADRPPDLRSSQQIVTSLGGTQTGARIHRPTDPFTITLKNPARYALGPNLDANGNVVGSVPFQVFSMLVRKGMYTTNGANARVGYARLDIAVPAGSDQWDAPNVKAMLGAFGGIWAVHSAAIVDGVLYGNFANG